ncbi:MAG: hypothetical protein EOP83_09645 [Verrucomicrobiaceae bacterium]|nr:MAG: hypothetical protein EOP83_09645 [Verrucomicrobiaceae bacterium]
MAGLKPATRTKRPPRQDSDSNPTLPAFRHPQLATLSTHVPQGDDWLFEMKYDGYRCQAAIAGDKVRLYTRRGHDWNDRFGYIAPALARLTKGSALVDGELCAIDQHGRSNFTLLENSLDGRKPVVFSAFDLLEQNGEVGQASHQGGRTRGRVCRPPPPDERTYFRSVVGSEHRSDGDPISCRKAHRAHTRC